MSLPVIYMDAAFLGGMLLAALVAGALLGWLLVRRRAAPAASVESPSDTRLLLQLMSRADHALDNYVTSIQRPLEVGQGLLVGAGAQGPLSGDGPRGVPWPGLHG